MPASATPPRPPCPPDGRPLARQVRRSLGLITRPRAAATMAAMIAVAVATIVVTRAYLALTGYPQVGGEIFHIAHAVWGGLLLMVAVTLLLVVSNRWVIPVAAVTGGLGIGLFIDEVGKFITQDNDYFFPLAAPVSYAVLTLLGVVALRVAARERTEPREHLHTALDLAQALADGPVTQRRLARVAHHLRRAEALGCDPQQQALVAALQESVAEARRHAVPDESRWTGRLLGRWSRFEDRWLPMHRVRALTRVALGALGVVGVLAGPGVLALAVWQLVANDSVAGSNSLMGDSPGPVAWTTAAIAAVMGTAAGVLAWRAVRRMGADSEDLGQGVRAGIAALLLLMGGVNVMNAYFNQFYVLVDATLQGGVLGLLLRLRRHAEGGTDASRAS